MKHKWCISKKIKLCSQWLPQVWCAEVSHHLGSVLTRGRSHLNILYVTKLNQEFHILQALCHPVGIPLFHAIWHITSLFHSFAVDWSKPCWQAAHDCTSCYMTLVGGTPKEWGVPMYDLVMHIRRNSLLLAVNANVQMLQHSRWFSWCLWHHTTS